MEVNIFDAKESFQNAFTERYYYLFGKELTEGSLYEKYYALAYLVRGYISKKWIASSCHCIEKGQKQVYYLSIEFLLGRLLGQNLLNLGYYDEIKEYLADLGIKLEELEELEHDAGLGNGGLGRLAACFLDSLACLGLPGNGCGIRYKYGLFEQKFIDGLQMELPDNWLKNGYPWEIRRADKKVEVRFRGEVRTEVRTNGLTFIHEKYEKVSAIPYDVPIVGCNNNVINTLRLWSAEISNDEQNTDPLNRDEYLKSMEQKFEIEAISRMLYPEDDHEDGKILRLKQQYFLVSAGMQSIIRHYKKKKNGSLYDLPKKVAIHINDTHPVLAIPELMRILMDEEGMGWNDAWEITTRTISFTNHTILPEALEKWNVNLVGNLLPRIFMIIEEINKRFCQELWNKYPGQRHKIEQMAIISNDHVKMVNLAAVGSHSVNGVARIHTDILKREVLNDFHHFYPQKINNKTNGVTHRRWLIKSNPKLSSVITEAIGSSWRNHPTDLVYLLKQIDNGPLLKDLAKIKLANKEKLAKIIYEKNNIKVNPHSIFDVHVKRIHGYKRQLLNALHIMDLYNRLKDNPQLDIVPRTFIFGGKAAPSYYFAKSVIKLINNISKKINNDKDIRDKIKIVYLENYSVSLAENIFPAADISEQISTASKEASGTGNMKFCLNGAITIGTLDGANVEIMEEVGKNNFFHFGLTSEQVLNYYQKGGYNSWEMYEEDHRIKALVNQLIDTTWSQGEEFRGIYEALITYNDEFFVLKDFSQYVEAQNEVDKSFRNRDKWLRMSLTNIAHGGKFSSDKTIWEYAVGIWDINPMLIT